MNKDQLVKILDLARDYFISNSSIIDCYNEYAEANGLSKIYLDKERADNCIPCKSPEDALESLQTINATLVPTPALSPAEVKVGPLNEETVAGRRPTNYRDINGKQIYEGDILHSTLRDFKYQVKFKNDMFVANFIGKNQPDLLIDSLVRCFECKICENSVKGPFWIEIHGIESKIDEHTQKVDFSNPSLVYFNSKELIKITRRKYCEMLRWKRLRKISRETFVFKELIRVADYD